MDNRTGTAAYLLRMAGFFGIAVGLAWAVQTVGLGHETVAAKLSWIAAAASMAGAGAGLIVAGADLEGAGEAQVGG